MSSSVKSLKSMTGFARELLDGASHDVSVEIRSVNHRYLDVRVRAPSSLAPLEQKLKDRIASVLTRGKVEVAIHVAPKGESALTIDIDRPLVQELLTRLGELSRETGLAGELTVSDLLTFPSAFRVRERELAEASLWEAVEPALERALTSLDAMRAAEGAALAADMEARTRTLATHIGAIEKRSDDRREERRSELQKKIEELLASAVEPSTIAMEVARLVERGDVAEEVTRFRSHLELWRKTVTSGEPCGKKLDFIVQEMNREVNTIGSKSQDSEVAELVIAMKAEIERVREQVQNVE